MTTEQIQSYIYQRGGSLVRHYPTLVSWLAKRLSTDHFQGLPLTVLIGLLVINVMILSEIAENIVNSEPMVQVDQRFTQLLFQHRSLLIGRLFFLLTWLGSVYTTVGLTLLGSLYLFWQKKIRTIIILWFVLAGVGLTVQVGKRIFSRDRPLKVAYYMETGYSFPSGHSATAMALYGYLAYWLVRGRRRLRHPGLISAAAVSLILAVGFSRIYLGVHFLSDVIGGYLLGACWLILGIVWSEWQRTYPSTDLTA